MSPVDQFWMSFDTGLRRVAGTGAGSAASNAKCSSPTLCAVRMGRGVRRAGAAVRSKVARRLGRVMAANAKL